MSSEERVIRPYMGIDRISRVLDGCFVQMTQQHRIDPGNTKRMVAAEYLAYPVQLWLAPDEAGMTNLVSQLADGIHEAGLQAEDVEMVVLLSTSRLRWAEVVWRSRADELAKAVPHVDVSGDLRRLPLATPFGGCRIDVYLLLSKNLEEAPLRPWRRGTWLARARFDIKTDLGEVGFTPLPLTDDDRARLGLPKNTIRHVVVEDPFAEDAGADTIKLYIDEELLNQLALQPSLPAARAFQRQLFVDAMSALVYGASVARNVAERDWSDVEGTILGRLISRLAGPLSDRTETEHLLRCKGLLDDVADNPAKVIGWVEEIVPGLKAGQIDLLRGET